MTKILDQTIGDNHRIDKAIGEKTTDANIMEPEMIVEIEAEVK